MRTLALIIPIALAMCFAATLLESGWDAAMLLAKILLLLAVFIALMVWGMVRLFSNYGDENY